MPGTDGWWSLRGMSNKEQENTTKNNAEINKFIELQVVYMYEKLQICISSLFQLLLL